MSTQTKDLPLSRDCDAEAMSLGCVFINPKVLDELRQYLRPADYSYEPNRLIFSAMCAIVDRGDVPDPVTVADWLQDHGQLERAGGLAYVTPLSNSVPESYGAGGWAQIILKHAIRRQHYGLSLLHGGRSQSEDAALIAQIAEEEARLAEMQQRGKAEAGGDRQPAPLGVLLSDVQVEDFHWLWHGRVALGKITMADGDPGLGKSLFTTDLTARVSMGHTMPDDSPGLDGPAGVVLICGEDGLSDTVKPRLLAAGASPEACARVRAIDMIPETLSDGTISQRLLSLLADLGALEATITAMGARLLVIDPITAYLGNGVDMYRDSDLRRVLTPLAGLAERTSAAILLVRHLNKNTATPALHRGLGGVGFIGVARLGLLFAPNPDAEGEVLVSRHKGNIGQPPPTLAYRIVQVGEAENRPRISWLGERETSAGVALASQSGGGEDRETRSATDEAVAWLRAKLADGPLPAKMIQDDAKAEDITEKVLRTARLRTCKKPEKEGMKDGWKWELDPAKMPSPGDEGTFGEQERVKPESNGAPPKMPSSESNGHLRATTPPKMPSENENGHLRAEAEFNGLGGHSIGVSAPKMPSDGRKDIFDGGDIHKQSPSDVHANGAIPGSNGHSANDRDRLRSWAERENWRSVASKKRAITVGPGEDAWLKFLGHPDSGPAIQDMLEIVEQLDALVVQHG